MAYENEVSALEFIKFHLLGEFSPVPHLMAKVSSSSQASSSASSMSDYFYADPGAPQQHQALADDFFIEFKTKPQIIDLTTPKPDNSSSQSETQNSSESNHFFGFELESKPQIVDLTVTAPEPIQSSPSPSPSPSPQSNRKPSLKIALPVPNKTQWLQFTNPKPEPNPSVPAQKSSNVDQQQRHYRGVRQRPWGKLAAEIHYNDDEHKNDRTQAETRTLIKRPKPTKRADHEPAAGPATAGGSSTSNNIPPLIEASHDDSQFEITSKDGNNMKQDRAIKENWGSYFSRFWSGLFVSDDEISLSSGNGDVKRKAVVNKDQETNPRKSQSNKQVEHQKPQGNPKKKIEKVMNVVLKADINVEASRREIFSSIVKVEGVELVEFDMKNSLVSVTGAFDVVELIAYVRKTTGKDIELSSAKAQKEENGEPKKLKEMNIEGNQQPPKYTYYEEKKGNKEKECMMMNNNNGYYYHYDQFYTDAGPAPKEKEFMMMKKNNGYNYDQFRPAVAAYSAVREYNTFAVQPYYSLFSDENPDNCSIM